jgi:Bax protein
MTPYTILHSIRKSPAIKALLFIFFIIAWMSSPAQSKAYVKKYAALADSLGKEYGIPYAVILGVAIIESSSGTGRNVKLLNNHFGIVGKNKLKKTKGIKTMYKQYENARESYLDFCKLLEKRKFYKKLKGNKDYNLWIDAISKSGYSEAPTIWKQRIIATIKANKLAATR